MLSVFFNKDFLRGLDVYRKTKQVDLFRLTFLTIVHEFSLLLRGQSD